MKRLLLDSGVAADFINRRRGIFEQVKERVRQGVRVGIGVPVLAELAYGIEHSQHRDRNMRSLLSSLPALTLWPFDRAAAFTYGRIAADLRRAGRPMQSNDIMIAAIALTLGSCLIATTDSDLDAVPGLSIEHW